MNVLILEDDLDKLGLVRRAVEEAEISAVITTCVDFQCFLKSLEREDFDLIIVDLVVPQFADSTPDNLTDQIIDATRDHHCRNFRVPVVALTKFNEAAESGFKQLNQKDIAVITFSKDKADWKISLADKVKACVPFKKYDFLIVCALQKEVDGFTDAGCDVGPVQGVKGLECREISIGSRPGVIVTAPRMGLVNCAIATSRAIDMFSPNTVCMSGICAGIQGKAKIYDVVIPEVCHQHDFGKWSVDGFVPELYSVQIDNSVRLTITEALQLPSFKDTVLDNIRPSKTEIPDGEEFLDFRVFFAPASSGSAVVADPEMTEVIKDQHRKSTAFEMESFALYEAARLSISQPKFFSAKTVVDDGSPQKNDDYHRIGCLLSAKVVHTLILNGV